MTEFWRKKRVMRHACHRKVTDGFRIVFKWNASCGFGFRGQGLAVFSRRLIYLASCNMPYFFFRAVDVAGSGRHRQFRMVRWYLCMSQLYIVSAPCRRWRVRHVLKFFVNSSASIKIHLSIIRKKTRIKFQIMIKMASSSSLTTMSQTTTLTLIFFWWRCDTVCMVLIGSDEHLVTQVRAETQILGYIMYCYNGSLHQRHPTWPSRLLHTSSWLGGSILRRIFVNKSVLARAVQLLVDQPVFFGQWQARVYLNTGPNL